ncbi:MAG: hypothetical protein ACKV2O_04065 [Acidimicrobiales bacterium]
MSQDPPFPASTRIRLGEVQLVAIHDVADEIDLARLEREARAAGGHAAPDIRRLTVERQPGAVAFANPPVTARLADRSFRVDGQQHAVRVRARFFDFGAVSVQWSFTMPPDLALGALVQLSVALESPELRSWLAVQMAADVDAALAAAGDAVVRPARQAEAEYLTVYVVTDFDGPVDISELTNSAEVAQLVLGEAATLSEQLRADIRNASYSYTDQDLVVIGYDQAFIFDPISAADLSALLEFALAQVLELGFYDSQLDRRLAELSSAVSRPMRQARRWGLGGSSFEALRRDVLVHHVELVEVLERVTAAVKITDDLHYARIYRAAMRVFRAGELIEATNRKLELLFRTYTMLADEVDSQVAHRLEWIIIALIFIEIVLALTRVI